MATASDSELMLYENGSTSTSTGLSPAQIAALIVELNVKSEMKHGDP